MPSRTLPTFTVAQVASHKSSKSCFVTVGRNVYDVTDFLDSHPGGSDLVLEYGGKDVSDILKDGASHTHSEAAYEVLDDSLVGHLEGTATNGKANGAPAANGAAVNPRTGMSSEEDLSKDTDIDGDYKTHKFLDLNKPLLMQVWYGGFSKDFYLEQVHRPRHYKGGASAPLFGNFLEPLSKTPWWLIPLIWIPAISYGLYVASEGFDTVYQEAAFFLGGLSLWSLLEYILHRFLFHLDEYVPSLPASSRRPLTQSPGGFLTTELASHCTFCSTECITICPWTSTVWSCPRLSSSRWPRRSGSSPTSSSRTTGTSPRRCSAAACSDTSATT